MIVYEITAHHKLLQPPTINQSPYHIGSSKKPEIQNTKCETIHKKDNRPNLMQNMLNIKQ